MPDSSKHTEWQPWGDYFLKQFIALWTRPHGTHPNFFLLDNYVHSHASVIPSWISDYVDCERHDNLLFLWGKEKPNEIHMLNFPSYSRNIDTIARTKQVMLCIMLNSLLWLWNKAVCMSKQIYLLRPLKTWLSSKILYRSTLDMKIQTKHIYRNVCVCALWRDHIVIHIYPLHKYLLIRAAAQIVLRPGRKTGNFCGVFVLLRVWS